jgi:hypothetical protein
VERESSLTQGRQRKSTSANRLRWKFEMSDTQLLTIALAVVPNMLAVLVGILINNSRLSDTNMRIGELRLHIDTRFDEMRDLWRSELYRVEQVIDGRLKHLEDRG